MVKKMVRLALASEYARQPIRRGDVGVKGVCVSHYTKLAGLSVVKGASADTVGVGCSSGRAWRTTVQVCL